MRVQAHGSTLSVGSDARVEWGGALRMWDRRGRGGQDVQKNKTKKNVDAISMGQVVALKWSFFGARSFFFISTWHGPPHGLSSTGLVGRCQLPAAQEGTCQRCQQRDPAQEPSHLQLFQARVENQRNINGRVELCVERVLVRLRERPQPVQQYRWWWWWWWWW